MEKKKRLTPIKIFIMVLIAFIVGVGGWALLTINNYDDLIKWMDAYKSYALAISPVFSILVFLVGGSGFIQKTKWGKDDGKNKS